LQKELLGYKKTLSLNNIEIPKDIAISPEEMNSEFGGKKQIAASV